MELSIVFIIELGENFKQSRNSSFLGIYQKKKLYIRQPFQQKAIN